jgi:hypothetical protein
MAGWHFLQLPDGLGDGVNKLRLRFGLLRLRDCHFVSSLSIRIISQGEQDVKQGEQDDTLEA